MSIPGIYQFPHAGAVVEALLDYLVAIIQQVIARQGCCRWALAGGDTPRRLYHRLSRPDTARWLDWNRIHLFWGDERCVPSSHPQSNYRMVRESLLDHVSIPAGNIFPIDGQLDSERAAAAYAEVLGGEPLDLLLLGMGEDGHTASLYATTPRLREELRLVIATKSPMPPTDRISLTLRTINAARQVVFLVVGEHKANRLAQVMEQHGRQEATLPAAMVNPESGALHWFVDLAAAARLPKTKPPDKD
ncbi:MAG: 6-phosphogluconolactonase [Acidobacteria bacterium]|nr:6-phosphogluconolactonase [Acidobacteriota bacterium]